MDRKAFKQRMQALKSYQENNPGKGYWDWKVEAFEDGGEVNDFDKLRKYRNFSTEDYPIYYDELQDLQDQRAKLKNEYQKHKEYQDQLTRRREQIAKQYNVPYIKEKEITLSNAGSMTGAKLTTNLLDSIYKYANKVGLPLEEAVGLPAQETTFGKYIHRNGHRFYDNQDRSEYVPHLITSDWRYIGDHINDYLYKKEINSDSKKTKALKKQVYDNFMSYDSAITDQERREAQILQTEVTISELKDRLKFIEDHKKDYQKAYDEYEKETKMSPFEHAFRYYKSGKYNPHDSQHTKMVREKGRLVMQSPEFKQWYNTKKYAEGGEIPPTEEEPIQERMPYQGKLYKDAIGRQYTEDQYYNYFRNSTDEIDKFTGMPRVIGLKPVIDLEDAANFTPIGDVISVNDTYNAVKNRDWFGAGAAALSILPFIPNAKKLGKIIPTPTVNRTFAKQLDERQAAYNRVKGEYNDQLDSALESLIENEDAFRRAANADKAAGTKYVDVYTKSLQNKANNPSELPKPYILETKPNQKAYVSAHDPETINISRSYVDNSQSLESGLITHELGHSTDIKAGFDYVDKLGDPSKFIDDEALRKMYPTKADKIKSYLLKGTEIKSHMNEFRQFLFDNHDLLERETVNSLKRKLFNSPYDNLKKIFNAYKSKRQFLKDFNTVPMVSNNNPNNLA